MLFCSEPITIKKSPPKKAELNNHSSNPLIVRVHSLRLAPSIMGVAVASQILCISTTLNKRKASIRLFGYKLQLSPLFVKHFLLTNAGNRQIFSFSRAGKATHRPLLICPV